MDKCKMDVVHSLEQQLIGQLDKAQIGAVSDKLVKILAEYDVKKISTDLIPYDDTNTRILKQYCACLFVDGKSEKTIYQYKRACQRLADAIGKEYTQMGVFDIRYYLACEKDRGVSARSVENTRAFLSAFFQWMAKEEYISKNPCLNITPIKYPDIIRLPFSDVEIDSLRAACKNKKERALVELLLSSGARVSEIAGMNISDINTIDRSVHIRHGKGDKGRITYITNVAMKHLEAYWKTRSETGDAAFYNNKHEALKVGGIRHMLKEIGKRAGVESVHPHRFRRTFASKLAERGMKVQDIQKLMGHSNIETTMEYVYTSDQMVSAAYQQYIA